MDNNNEYLKNDILNMMLKLNKIRQSQRERSKKYYDAHKDELKQQRSEAKILRQKKKEELKASYQKPEPKKRGRKPIQIFDENIIKNFLHKIN